MSARELYEATVARGELGAPSIAWDALTPREKAGWVHAAGEGAEPDQDGP